MPDARRAPVVAGDAHAAGGEGRDGVNSDKWIDAGFGMACLLWACCGIGLLLSQLIGFSFLMYAGIASISFLVIVAVIAGVSMLWQAFRRP